MNSRRSTAWDLTVIIGAPLALAILELFHPHAHDVLQLPMPDWLIVHYAQLLLFPASALSLALLVRGRDGVAPALCRFAAFVFAVTYTAFDTAAGVVTGILANAAQASAAPESWRAATETVWAHPIVGGASTVAFPLLAVAGSVALFAATVSAAAAMRRSGGSWPPVVLLAVSGVGISIFKTHAWPGGPLTFGTMAMAMAWLLWERASAPGSAAEATSA